MIYGPCVIISERLIKDDTKTECGRAVLSQVGSQGSEPTCSGTLSL